MEVENFERKRVKPIAVVLGHNASKTALSLGLVADSQRLLRSTLCDTDFCVVSFSSSSVKCFSEKIHNTERNVELWRGRGR